MFNKDDFVLRWFISFLLVFALLAIVVLVVSAPTQPGETFVPGWTNTIIVGIIVGLVSLFFGFLIAAVQTDE